MNFETIAGGKAEVRATRPQAGLLAHSNHFLAEDFAAIDAYVGKSPHSTTRIDAMWRGMKRDSPSIARLQEVLRGHEHAPNGICSHPDPAAHPLYARTTVASVIMDLTASEFWFTDGPPCEDTYAMYSLPAQVAQL